MAFGPFAPVYAQEATESAVKAVENASEASNSASEYIQSLMSTPNMPTTLRFPFDESQNKIAVTSSFGEERSIPEAKNASKHNGLDFDLKTGTKVFSVDDGEVVISGESDYGITVTVKHSWGKTVYGHLSKTDVEKNQKVTKGQVIGEAGNTGQSTGSHLHFGIKPEKNSENMIDGFIDPAQYFGLNEIASEKAPRNDALLEATASASLENVVMPGFEDLRGKTGYLYNYKFNLSEKTSIHFDHKKRVEPGFAVVDEKENYKLRFFLKEKTSPPPSGLATQDNRTLKVKENDLGFLRVRSDSSTSSEELARVNIGQEFTILESKSSWYKIEYQEGTFGWVSGVYTEVKNEEDLDSGSDDLSTKNAQVAEGKVFDNKIEYPVTISGIAMTLRYTLSQSGVKEEFIINERPADEIFKKIESKLEIPFNVENEGLEIEKEENGGYEFNLEGGDYWQILPPNIKDSKSKDVETKPISANLENNTYTLTVDKAYLEAASYPVVIDPTVIVNTSSVTTATQASIQRHVVTTSDGTIHNFVQIGTQTATCGGVSQSGLLWFNSTDSGVTWVCQAQFSSDTTNQRFADVRVDSSDNIYVVYSQTGSSTSVVNYRKLTKGIGASWTLGTQRSLTVASGNAHYATLELEGTTRMWVALKSTIGSNIQVAVYYSDGLSDNPTWTQSIAALDTTGTNGSMHYSTIVRYGSKIGVIYDDEPSGGVLKIRSRSDGDPLTHWGSEIAIFNTTVTSPVFSSIGTSEGNIFAAVSRSTGTFFMYFNGQTWASPTTVSATGTSTHTSLATDGTSVWVFYGEANELNTQLSGNKKLVYKKGVAPYAASNFDTNATPVVSYHRVFDKYWSYVGGVYTDDTVDAASTTATDTQMITSIGDSVYFGMSEVYDSISWDISTNGAGGTVDWEYCSAVDGSSACTTWSALTFTSTGNAASQELLQDGYGAFTAPADWVSGKVNSESTAYYYVRSRATANYSTTPVGAQMAAIPQINGIAATGAITANTTQVIWTENAATVTRVRSAAVTTTTSAAPSTTAEISPTVAAYGSSTTATNVSTQRHMVKTTDGTMHMFIQAATSTSVQQQACGSSTSSNNNTGLMWLYSTDSGSTWVCGGQISSDTTNLMYADARADSSDNIYVVYSTNSVAAAAVNDVLYRKLTKGSGATWTLEAAQTVVDASASEGYSQATIEVEGTNRLWIATRYFVSTNNMQIATYYSDGLTAAPTWTVSASAFDTSGSSSTSADYPILVRFGTNIGVIWRSSAAFGTRWRYRADSDSLTSWSTQATVSTNNTAGATISALGDSLGNVYVATNNGTAVNFTYYNGSSWSGLATVSSAATNTLMVSLSLDNAATPNVYVLYGDTTGLSVALSGSRKLVYKKGVFPYATENFDANATEVVSYQGTFNKVWTFISGVYTDETTDAASGSSADVNLPSAIGDIAYFGRTAKFDSLSINSNTAGTNGQVIWEYYNGSAWMPLTDYYATSNVNFTGNGYITFAPHTNWATTSINGEGGGYYYIRARVITNYSVAPISGQAASIPQINWGSLAASNQGMYAIWTENAANPSRVRYSTIQSFNATPSAPTSLGPTAYVNGSFGIDNTPDLTFSLADTDVSDTLKYQIQIDDSSDFGSPVVDYTSALAAQGSRTFTAGQAAGSGTYATGSEGQTLSDGSYYWRVRAIDNGNSTSGYTTANSGSIAFKIDTTVPTTPTGLTSSDHTTLTWSADSTLSMSWTASTDSGSGIAGYSYSVDTTSNTTPDTSSDTAGTTATTDPLSSGNSYYFHVRAIDAVGNAGSSTHSGPYYIDVTVPTTPGTPSTASPTSDTTPTWVWTASSDAHSGLVATPYTIQWSQSSDFSGTTFSTTTANLTYTHSTTLAEGTWYFRVRSTDNVSNTSSYATGSVVITLTSSANLELDSPGNESFSNNSRPTFRWKSTSTTNVSYTFHIDNGAGGDINISGIPASQTTDVVTSKYVIRYENFADSDPSNNYISLYTKSSGDWSTGENNGELREGKRGWSVTAYDNAGNTTTSSRSLYADYTNPEIVNAAVENLTDIDGYLLVTNTKPKLSGKITDNLAYSYIEVKFERENYFLGVVTSTSITNIIKFDLNNINNQTLLDFILSSTEAIDYGKYYMTITGIDKAGNRSSGNTLKINLLTDDKARQLILLKAKDSDKKDLLEKLKEQTSQISLPELEKQAKLRREIEAAEFQKLLDQIALNFNYMKIGFEEYSKDFLSFTQYHTTMISLFLKENSESLYLVFNNIGELTTSLANSTNQFVALLFTAVNNTIAFASSAIIFGLDQVHLALDNASALFGSTVQYIASFTSNSLIAFQNNLFKATSDLFIALGQSTKPLVAALPNFMTDSFNAIFVKPFLALDTSVDNGNKNFKEMAKDSEQQTAVQLQILVDQSTESIKLLGQTGIWFTAQTQDIFAYCVQFASGIMSSFSNGLASIFNTFGTLIAEITGSTLNVLASVPSTLGTIVNTSLSQLSALLDNSANNFQRQIAIQYEDSSNGIESTMDKSYEALSLSFQAISKPIQQGADFLDRVKVGASTFYAIVIDEKPTMITDVTVEEIGKDYAIVSWKTNHYATGKVNYGKDLTYGEEVILEQKETYHKAVLTGLEPGERFYFEVMSEGKNYTYDAFYSFETPAQ